MTASSFTSEKPAAKNRRHSYVVAGLVMIVVATAAYLGWQHLAHSPGAAPPAPAPAVPVIATTVQQHDFPIVLAGIGTVTALNTAAVRSQVTGLLVDVPFKEGQFVKK